MLATNSLPQAHGNSCKSEPCSRPTASDKPGQFKVLGICEE
jgi:hypothetical protein